uniref:Uncharacterized protein n=1 Tax=Anguilla anguilla TaxID=7936 RepID=A0A0E9X6C7_ANGAN
MNKSTNRALNVLPLRNGMCSAQHIYILKFPTILKLLLMSCTSGNDKLSAQRPQWSCGQTQCSTFTYKDSELIAQISATKASWHRILGYQNLSYSTPT